MKPITYSLRSASGGLRCLVRCPQSMVYGLRSASAFTLVELLVVIVVISILAGITLPLSRYAIKRANLARQEIMLAKIHSALDDYRAAYGEYPITPPAPTADVLRHYAVSCDTYDAATTSSPFVKVAFDGTNTMEIFSDVHTNFHEIDYCLTYPLMFKQLEKGARPFMEFPIVDEAYLVFHSEDTHWVTMWRRLKNGTWSSKEGLFVYGDAIKRAKAVDPVSGRQWSYVCTNGIFYTITTNSTY